MKQALFFSFFALLISAGSACQAEGKFFKVEREPSGVWWFCNPQGEKFVSLGISDIPPGPNREHYDPANPGYAAFRYYDTTDAWVTSVRRNMQNWAFNTVGAWAHKDIASDELPETRVLHWGSSLQVPWCDIFADDFEKQVETFAKHEVAPCATESNLIGWFTDNELQWYGDTLFHFHLHTDQTPQTRQKLIALLREHYHDDFAVMNRDFDVGDATSFEELGRQGDVNLLPSGGGIAAVDRFTFLVAERYYRVMHDAIRRYDQYHLILGDRYMSYCPPAVARAAGPYVDIISTNFDWPDWKGGQLPTQYLRMLHDESGKPVLITEWYVAAEENRSGNRNRGVAFTVVPTQKQRALTAERRLAALLSEPYIVGAHWFRYADEPTNGRSADGEDFNFGLVDIHNKPYEHLVAGMRRANQRANEVHTASVSSNDASVVPVPRHIPDTDFPGSVEQFGPVASGSSAPLADLRVAWDEDQLYLGLVGFRFVDENLFANGKIPASHQQQLQVKVGQDTVELTFDPDAESGTQPAELAVVETRHRHLGVRFTYLIKVRAANLQSIAGLKQGAVVPLEVKMKDPSGHATHWQVSLVLENQVDRLAKKVSLDADVP